MTPNDNIWKMCIRDSHIAFHYTGDQEEGKTTSYQIDNIVVGKDIPTVVNTEPVSYTHLSVLRSFGIFHISHPSCRLKLRSRSFLLP